MASEKAWYWLAAGVLALGLNGAYQDGQFGWAHNLADRSLEMVGRASERGFGFVTAAELMLGRNRDSLTGTEATLQRMQAKLSCKRMDMLERSNDLAQMQRDLAAAHLDRQLANVQVKMDKVRVMAAMESANRGRKCSGFSRMVVSVPNIDLSNLPEVQLPEIPEIQEPHHSHEPI
jgi:hypothetical protein